MASGFTNEPINMNVVAGTTFGMGHICFVAANEVQKTAITQVATFVTIDESSRDAAGTLEVTGATVSVSPLAGVLFVQSADPAWTIGQLAYVGANGQATTTVGSNKLLGVCMGLHTGLTAGDLIAINCSQAATA